MVSKEGQPALGSVRTSWRSFIQREMVLSERSKPIMRSSPCIRGAPQVGFSTTIRKISSRNLLRRPSSSNLLPNSGDQPPVQTKTCPVPADDGFRCDDEALVSILTRSVERQPRRAYRRGRGSGEGADVSAPRVVAGARDSPKQDSRGYGKRRIKAPIQRKTG